MKSKIHKQIMHKSALILTGLALVGCESATQTTTNERGFSVEQLALGDQVFQQNCQVCHGEKAQGLVSDWKKTLPDGSYPAPPLDGSAHAWHHDDKVLLRTINQGGVKLGGTMPAFKDALSDDEKTAVLSYIKNLWPEKIYSKWRERNG